MAKRVFRSRGDEPGLAGSSLIRPSYNDDELKKVVDVTVDELLPPPKRRDFNLVTIDQYNQLLTQFDDLLVQFETSNILTEEFRLRINELETQLNNLESQLESAGELEKSLRNQITDLNNRLTKALGDFNTAIQRATDAEVKNATLSGEVSGLKSQVSALQSQINSLNSLIAGGAAAGGGGGTGGRATQAPTRAPQTPTPPPTTPRPPGSTPPPTTPTPTPTYKSPGDMPYEERIRREEARRDSETPGWREPIEAEIKRARDYWYTLPRDTNVIVKELWRICQIKVSKDVSSNWQFYPAALGVFGDCMNGDFTNDIRYMDGKNYAGDQRQFEGGNGPQNAPPCNGTDCYQVYKSFLDSILINSPTVPNLQKFDLYNTTYTGWATGLPISQPTEFKYTQGVRSLDGYDRVDGKDLDFEITTESSTELSEEMQTPVKLVFKPNAWTGPDVISLLGFTRPRSISEAQSTDFRSLPFGFCGAGSSGYSTWNQKTGTNRPGETGDPYQFKSRRGTLFVLNLHSKDPKISTSTQIVTIKKTIYNGNGLELGTPISSDIYEVPYSSISSIFFGTITQLENNVEFEILKVEEDISADSQVIDLNVKLNGTSTIVPLRPLMRYAYFLPEGFPGYDPKFFTYMGSGAIHTETDYGISRFWNDPFNPQGKRLKDGERVQDKFIVVPDGTSYTVKVKKFSSVKWGEGQISTSNYDPFAYYQVFYPNAEHKKVIYTFDNKPWNMIRRFSPVYRRTLTGWKKIGFYKHTPFQTVCSRHLFTDFEDLRKDDWADKYIGLAETRIYENKEAAAREEFRNATREEIIELYESGFRITPPEFPDPPPLTHYGWISRDVDLNITFEPTPPNLFEVKFTRNPIPFPQNDPFFINTPTTDQQYSTFAGNFTLKGYKLLPEDAQIIIKFNKGGIVPESIAALDLSLYGGNKLNNDFATNFAADGQGSISNIEIPVVKFGHNAVNSEPGNRSYPVEITSDWTYVNTILTGIGDVDKYNSAYDESKLKSEYIVNPSSYFNSINVNEGVMRILYLVVRYKNWDGSGVFEIHPLMFGRQGTGTTQSPLISVSDEDGTGKTILIGKNVVPSGQNIKFKIFTQNESVRWIIAGIPDWILPKNETNTSNTFIPVNGVVAGQGNATIQLTIQPYINSNSTSPSQRSVRLYVQDAENNLNYSSPTDPRIETGTNYAVIPIYQNKVTPDTQKTLVFESENLTNLSNSAHSKTVRINTNNDNTLQWELTKNSAMWITFDGNVKLTGNGNRTFTLQVAKNDDSNSREAIITLRNTNGNAPPTTIQLTQLSSSGGVGSGNQLRFRNITTQQLLSLPNQGILGELEILVSPGTNWNLSTTESWIVFNDQQVSGTGPLTTQVRIQPNTTQSNRSAIILLEGVSGINPDSSITLTQLGTVSTGGDSNTPTYMEFLTLPVVGQSGQLLITQPVLQLKRDNGTVVTNDNQTTVEVILSKSVTLLGNSSRLDGTKTARAINGIVTFKDLRLTGDPGSINTLQFTTTNIPPVDTKTRIRIDLVLPQATQYQIRSTGLFGQSTTFEWISPDDKINVKTMFMDQGGFDISAKGDGVIITSGNGIIDPPSNGNGYRAHLQSAPIYQYGIYVAFDDEFELTYIDNTLTRRTLLKRADRNETTSYIIEAVVNSINIISGNPRIEKLA